MKLDIEKLKKFEKLPPDVKRQLALYMSKWKEKKKESKIKNDFSTFGGVIIWGNRLLVFSSLLV